MWRDTETAHRTTSSARIVVERSALLDEQMVDEGIVVGDRRSPHGDGSRAGWFKVKDRGWY